jgi:hypothetical protein
MYHVSSGHIACWCYGRVSKYTQLAHPLVGFLVFLSHPLNLLLTSVLDDM